MEPTPLPPAIPPASTVLGEQNAEASQWSESNSSDIDQSSLHRSSQWDRQIDRASIATAAAQPHSWQHELATVRQSFIRQILGLNPFKTSYFALYRPLDDFQSRSILILAILLSIAAGVPLPLIGVILGKIINNFPPSENELKIRLIQLMSTAVGYFAVTFGWSICWGIVGERVARKTRESLVERALGMEMAYFDTVSPDLTSILTEKTQTIQLGTSEKVGLFITSISYFLAAFTVGFLLNARLTAVMLVTVIPSMAAIVCIGTNLVSRFSKEAAAFSEKATAVAASAIRAVQVVQAFGVSDKLAKDHYKFIREALRAGVKKSIAGAVMLGSVWFVAYAANALAFWYGNHLRFSDGSASGEAGTIYAVIFLILDASFVVGSFGPFIQTFALAAAAGQAVFSILDAPPSEIDVYSPEGDIVQADHFKEDISLQDVSFVYPARPQVKVLDDVTLNFQAGRLTGVVGPSGSGKSTITALILRLYDPSVGKVMLGSKDIRSLNIRSLRSRMALVTQSPVLFTGTILENIRHGISSHEDLSEEEILSRCTQAADEAHCDFLAHLPDGINTKVGTGHHSQLSGGQKQRIALARALVGRPSLLLLDEFTSAMDATSEAAVLENLKRSSSTSNRTTIVIAHRLATVKDADHILVLKDGAVIESGHHEALVKAEGTYAELIRAQQFEKKQDTPVSSSSHSIKESARAENGTNHKVHDPHSDTAPLLAKEQPKKTSTQLVRRALKLSRKQHPIIGLGLLASIISGSIIVGEAIIFGNLVELLNDPSNSARLESQVSFFCLMFSLLAIVALLSHTGGGTAFGFASEHLVASVRDVSFRTILMQDISWFSLPKNAQHELMARLNSDSGSIAGLSGVILGTLLSITTSVVGGMILAHIVAWKIAIVLLAAVPVMLVAGFLRLRILAQAEERHRTAYNSAAALASEACSAIQTVAALGREREVLSLYKAAIKEPYEKSLTFCIWGNTLLALSLSITYFVYALAYWWGSKQVRNGNYDQRAFFTVLPALLFSAQAAGQMFSLAPEITRAKTAAQSVFALHDERPSIITESRPTSSASSTNPDSAFGEVEQSANSKTGQLEFCEVSLKYESRPDVFALDGVSFLIKAGERVAFVGRSGAGKSSTMQLIERFHDPTYGSILLDNRDIRGEPVQGHRAKLGLVEQEPDLFPGSVKFNISLGAKHEFIMSLPEGYNTEVGSHGSKLSGGQRQRIAIARALIRDPEILLLDEATSQLDANTELEIRKAIAAASSGRTTIMIAHRLASVQHADRIFVFEGGRIVEQGRHDDLVAQGGIYAGMVQRQILE